MAFKLLSVAPRQGLAWIVAGWGVFRSRPMSFVGLFATFMIAALAISVVPFVGGVVGLATVPLLSVGFMIGSRRAAAGEAIRASVLIDALRGDPVRRAAMLRKVRRRSAARSSSSCRPHAQQTHHGSESHARRGAPC